MLLIKKEDSNIKVRLYSGGDLIDEVDFPLDFHFDTMLVTSIDKILKKNRIGKVSPLEATLEGFDDESNMAYMIARAAIEALKTK